MKVIKKETITINENDFAEASANVIRRILNFASESEGISDLEKNILKETFTQFSGDLFMELFVEVTDKESNKEE